MKFIQSFPSPLPTCPCLAPVPYGASEFSAGSGAHAHPYCEKREGRKTTLPNRTPEPGKNPLLPAKPPQFSAYSSSSAVLLQEISIAPISALQGACGQTSHLPPRMPPHQVSNQLWS